MCRQHKEPLLWDIYEVCSKSILIGIVVVVHWVRCVCNQYWHVRACLSNSWHKLQVAAFAQLAVVGRGSNTCVYVIAIFTMCESTEQHICIKFCFKIGKTTTEMYQLLQQAYGEDAVGRTQMFDWFRRFKEGRTSIESHIDVQGRLHTAQCATNLKHIYRIYSIPTHDKHQWLLLQFIVLLMMDAKGVRNM